MMKLTIEQLRKVNMEIRSLVLSALLLLFSASLFSQNNNLNDGYCSEKKGSIIDFEVTSKRLYATYSEKSEGVIIRIINSSDKSQFLFSGYLDSKYHSSKYLHRVDRKSKKYKLSFLPLIPYLSTKPTDKQIIGSERIVNKGQILYEFVELMPNSYYELEVRYDNFKLIGDLVCDFKPNEMSKFEPIKFKYLKSDKFKDELSLVLEFAAYRDIDLLCKESAYYLEEHEFNAQAKAFEIVSLQVKIENYDHPLF